MQSQERQIDIVTACDDRYALPLAVAVRSLLESIDDNNPSIRLTILTQSLDECNRQKCVESWGPWTFQCNWINPNTESLARVPTTAQLPLPTYFRFLIPDLLLDSSKALYLDPDILVLKSIRNLWETDVSDVPLAAVQDLGCPMVHFPSKLSNYRLARKYLLGVDPIPNYKELSIPGEATYFNAGVMLMNLDLWRKEKLGEKLIKFAVEHADHNVSADQYAINGLLWNRIRQIDARWNQLQAIHDVPGWQESIFNKHTFKEVRDTNGTVVP